MEIIDKTANYYKLNAVDYFNSTINIDLSLLYSNIEKYFTDKSGITLDCGCGSARDSAHLLRCGYTKIISMDLSFELLRAARGNFENCILANADYYNIPVKTGKIQYLLANASLLHIPKTQIMDVLTELRRILRMDYASRIYATFKLGAGECYDERGRFFAYYSESEICGIFMNAGFKICTVNISESSDKRPIRWITVVAALKIE